MLHALVTGDTIADTRWLDFDEDRGTVWWDGSRWYDFRGNQALATSLGWQPITTDPRPADTATTTWERAEPALVNGVPTVIWNERDKTAEEIAAEAEQNARLDDHEARLARIEAHLWPAPPDPTEPTDAPEWGDLDEPNRWPNGGLLLDTDGKVYRNISGSILTTPPSGFPGGGVAWLGNLFVVALAPDPEPERPAGYVGPWDANTSYAVGDVVDRDGRYYRCLVAHGAERQGTWGPGPATPTIWQDLGPV